MKRCVKYIFSLCIALLIAALPNNSMAQTVDSVSQKRKTVGLVLSGGGAKGLSHIGLIKALEENNIPIDYICGTSMGAIIGGLYAAGYTTDEMTALIKSKRFAAWQKGKPEILEGSYFYKDVPNAAMFSIFLQKGRIYQSDTTKKWMVALPTSAVSPYSMDFAVLDLFASQSKAAKFDFDSLMVPFFCVSADILNKKPYVARKGDLGASIRASMSIPGFFKPVTLDTLLLYDGGLYDNFPWKRMKEIYNPDYIIGSQCVKGKTIVDEDNVIALGMNLITSETDYSIPEDVGLLLFGDYDDYGIMAFDQIDKISEAGYRLALENMDKIKAAVGREVTENERTAKRKAFKEKCGPVRFYKDIQVSGEMNDEGKRFVDRMIRNDKRDNFGLEELKRGYYRVIQSGVAKSFSPSYVVDSPDSMSGIDDSLFILKIRASETAPFKLSLGGNVSSSSLNQIYLSARYLHAGMNPWKMKFDTNLGKYYSGFGYRFRHDVGIKPLAYYYAELIAHQFDYYNGNQNALSLNSMPKNVREKEFYLRAGIVTPLSLGKNFLTEAALVAGRRYQNFYLVEIAEDGDEPDRGSEFVVSGILALKSNTFDYQIYPTTGHSFTFGARYSYLNEEYTPGTTNHGAEKLTNMSYNTFRLRLKADKYFSFGKGFSLGLSTDMVYSKPTRMSNFYSELFAMSKYEPIPHSSTMLLGRYRAHSFAGFAVSPVIRFSDSFYAHTTAAYFVPYRQLLKADNGWQYSFSDKLPKGGMIANFALVWQSPVGPVSFSTAYYSKGDRKWYPQFNFGYLLFHRKSGDD